MKEDRTQKECVAARDTGITNDYTDIDRSIIRYVDTYGWGFRISSLLISRRFGLSLDAVQLKEKYLLLRASLKDAA
jgi:hypothetical protein